MTILLYKMREDADRHAGELEAFMKATKRFSVIQIKYDRRDHPKFGMRGIDFQARHGQKYFLVAENKREVKSWNLYSEIQ